MKSALTNKLSGNYSVLGKSVPVALVMVLLVASAGAAAAGVALSMTLDGTATVDHEAVKLSDTNFHNQDIDIVAGDEFDLTFTKKYMANDRSQALMEVVHLKNDDLTPAHLEGVTFYANETSGLHGDAGPWTVQNDGEITGGYLSMANVSDGVKIFVADDDGIHFEPGETWDVEYTIDTKNQLPDGNWDIDVYLENIKTADGDFTQNADQAPQDFSAVSE